jgi:hypothetical protein
MPNNKIIIAQFYTSNVPYGLYSEAINKKYCDEKGYIYFCEKDTSKILTTLKDRAATWYKPKLIEEILATYNPEYVLFLDADAIISDFNQNVEDFIDEKYDITFTEDVGHHSAMNAGVFILKNNEWSKNFLKIWWESADIFTPEDSRDLFILEQNAKQVGYFKNALWHDQTCLTILYENNEDIKNHIKIINSNSLNHTKYNDGNFIFHAFSYGHVHNRTLDIVYKEKIEPHNKENINLIVYHIYCVNNYLEIVTQQLNRLKISGLYDWCDKLEITCINTEDDFKDIEELLKNLKKVTLNKFTINNYEYEGINKVWEYSQQYSGKVFYFHTKGVANNYNNNIENKKSERKVKGVAWWKEIMEHYLIDNYKECIEKLDQYDQCGVTNNGGWWWGNFWWANLYYIKPNPKPLNGDRWYFESWLNIFRNPSYYEFYHFEFNPYYSQLPSDIYLNKDSYKDAKIEIIKAFYGTIGEQQDEGKQILDRTVVDVTEQIKLNLAAHQYKAINIRADNRIAGDPHYGFEKVLEVYFTINEKEYIIAVDEGKNLQFNL